MKKIAFSPECNGCETGCRRIVAAERDEVKITRSAHRAALHSNLGSNAVQLSEAQVSCGGKTEDGNCGIGIEKAEVTIARAPLVHIDYDTVLNSLQTAVNQIR